jgi:AcrR family transcriptional regulator
MNTESSRSPYTSPLRARQKEQTGALILEAVASILRRADLSAVTIAEVARVAEVTERTVYRHYKTRDELLRAFWPWQLERMGGRHVNAPRSLEAFMGALRSVFEGWDREESLVRAVFFSAESRQVRAPAMAQRLRYLEGFLADMAPDTPEAERRKIAASIMSLASVTNWLFLRDSCGYDGRQAADAAVKAIELILAGVRATKTTTNLG